MTKTLINSYVYYRFYVLIFFLLIGTPSLLAQTVWESPKLEIYNFLSRQAQKGHISFNDLVQPISRKEIAEHLASLDSVSTLTETEKKELQFYHKEYSEFQELSDSLTFFKKDPAGRWRFLSVQKDGFVLRGDPVLTFETTQSGYQHIYKQGNGVQFWGQAGKHFGFQFFFRDVTETGTGIDTLKYFTPEQGIVKTENPKANSLNYSELRGYLSYSWNNGKIAFGKDNILWGYGQNGRLVSSDKAPSYPFIRLDYQPLKWLYFQYTHAWLNSGIIDSARTNNTGNSVYGGKRELFVQKFFASHSLNFIPVKGLTLSMGESIVYSDRLNVGYLIPIMFFKAYDHYSSRYKISSGGNGQFFFQASSRNHLKNTHLYSTLFIDEIRMSTVFDRAKSRNQLGFNLGGSITDLFIPYLTLGLEYTRVNPFVYKNLIPAQDYTNQKYLLGDWMGNNADRFLAYIKYTPLPRLKTMFQVQKVRKGDGLTIEEQYFAEPQPPFLGTVASKNLEMQFRLSYELLNNIYVQGQLLWNKTNDLTTSTYINYTQFLFNVSFGL